LLDAERSGVKQTPLNRRRPARLTRSALDLPHHLWDKGADRHQLEIVLLRHS
jgi:hypothetical protein